MDRSFLSQPEVIAASQRFVCIRLATYENEGEFKATKAMYTGRSGDVENTTFTLLAPDGVTRLTRVGRSAKQVFNDAATMAKRMNEIADGYSNVAIGDRSLPTAADVRIGLDIAASDNQPLIVLVGTDAPLESTVASVAWQPEFLGRFTYVVTNLSDERKVISGQTKTPGIYVIEPDTFGQKGRVTAQLSARCTAIEIAAALRKAPHNTVAKESGSHRSNGIRQGAFWETRLPVTDPEEAKARERSKKAIQSAKPN